MISCTKCGNSYRDDGDYCPFCGEDSSDMTMQGGIDETDILNPIYCPHCQETNIKEAHFCQSCSKEIYKVPAVDILYCPKCKSKNKSISNFCLKCKADLNCWFLMLDPITTNLAHNADFIFTETMAEISYHFILNDDFSIGRAEDNDLINPCPWISSKHCLFNFESKYLKDNNSANGVFVNKSSDKIDRFPLDQISEFNLSGTFTYNIIQPGDLFVFQLMNIIEDVKCKTCGLKEKCNDFNKTCHIFVRGDGEIFIQKIDGKIVLKEKSNEEYFSIKIKNGFYYFTDAAKGIENRLLKKSTSNILSNNWKFKF